MQTFCVDVDRSTSNAFSEMAVNWRAEWIGVLCIGEGGEATEGETSA